MAKTKYQLALESLEHRRRECHENAASLSMEAIRGGADNRELAQEARDAVMQFDEIEHACELARSQTRWPRPVKAGANGQNRQRARKRPR